MTNATAAYQCPAISPRVTSGQLPVRLNTHQVELYLGPTCPRLATKQTGKRLRGMTGEQRQDFLRRKGVKTVKPTGPDPIATAQTSQGVLQRGFLGMVYDYTLGALENALAEDEVKPATIKPVARPKPSASGRLDDFFKDIEGDFKCLRQGKSCKAGSETLKGKIVLIGWAHDDDAGIQKIRDLLAKYMDVKTDKVIAEISPSEFRSAGTRDRRCMGVAMDRCVPGDMEGGTQRSLAATTKAAEAAAKLAHRLIQRLQPRLPADTRENRVFIRY
jgi:hypothetical protein